MQLFEILRQHAAEIPDRIATSSSRHRLTTYRKLWSRIERATARMQGEWMVGAGDRIGYAGHGHPDALLLWLAAARLGAVLVPLETPALLDAVGQTVQGLQIRLLLHDDDVRPAIDGDFCACLPLSTLIATPSSHRAASVPEDTTKPCLLQLNPPGSTLPREWEISMDDLLARPASDAPAVSGKLFDAVTLTALVLPALRAGRELRFP